MQCFQQRLGVMSRWTASALLLTPPQRRWVLLRMLNRTSMMRCASVKHLLPTACGRKGSTVPLVGGFSRSDYIECATPHVFRHVQVAAKSHGAAGAPATAPCMQSSSQGGDLVGFLGTLQRKYNFETVGMAQASDVRVLAECTYAMGVQSAALYLTTKSSQSLQRPGLSKLQAWPSITQSAATGAQQQHENTYMQPASDAPGQRSHTRVPLAEAGEVTRQEWDRLNDQLRSDGFAALELTEADGMYASTSVAPLHAVRIVRSRALERSLTAVWSATQLNESEHAGARPVRRRYTGC